MAATPAFSVLTASYNSAEHLRAAIESVRAQSFTDWELVIVDDASTDDSVEVARAITDPRLRVIVNDRNRGVGFTKNRLIAEARAPVCGILDGDDVLTSEALSVMHQAHRALPEAVFIYSRNYVCDDQLRIVLPEDRADPAADTSNVRGSEWTNHFATFKRDAAIRAGGINPHLRIAEDLDWVLRMQEEGPSLEVEDYLYYYRKNPASVTSTAKEAERARIVWNVVREAQERRRRNPGHAERISHAEVRSREARFRRAQGNQFRSADRHWAAAGSFLQGSLAHPTFSGRMEQFRMAVYSVLQGCGRGRKTGGDSD